ncbi:MAG TPA: hypothetical protein VH351_21945 [Bryobacteraceae bacterium]|nr:hypothetical protein [Bryobacteraceae bacterium]
MAGQSAQLAGMVQTDMVRMKADMVRMNRTVMLEERAAIALFRLQEQVVARALSLAAWALSFAAQLLALVARALSLVAPELGPVVLRQESRHRAIDWARRSLPALDPWRESGPAPGPASVQLPQQDFCCSLLTQCRWQAP